MAPRDRETYVIRGLCGGISSITAELVTFPIDTIKIRLQLMTGSTTTSAMHIVQSMIRTEGIGALWKGFSAALARQAVQSSARMAFYEPIRNMLGSSDTVWNKILAGGVVGALGASLANPNDVIKIRMQADTTGKVYTGLGNAFTTIIRKEGLRGVMRGVGPNMQRAFLVQAAQMSTYDHIKQTLKTSGHFQEGVLLHGSSSFFAGFAAACASTPADTIKTRMMQQPTGPDGKGLLYSSGLHCFRQTLRSEGVQGLYRGFIPTWMRIGPWAMVMFITYENLRDIADTLI